MRDILSPPEAEELAKLGGTFYEVSPDASDRAAPREFFYSIGDADTAAADANSVLFLKWTEGHAAAIPVTDLDYEMEAS
jgi:hypothetical protein